MRRLSMIAMCVSALLALSFAALAALPPEEGPATRVHVEFRFATAEPTPDWKAFELDGVPFFLDPEVLMNESHFALASARRGRGPVWHVEVILNEEGAKLLGEITTANLERRIGMVVDGKLVSAPVIKAPITQGRALISGDIDEQEARRIAAGVMAQYAPTSD